MIDEDEAIKQAGNLCRQWAQRVVGHEVMSFPTSEKAKFIGSVVVSADPKWHLSWVDGFNGKTFLRFHERAVKPYKGLKIHLIVENARYHRTQENSQW